MKSTAPALPPRLAKLFEWAVVTGMALCPHCGRLFERSALRRPDETSPAFFTWRTTSPNPRRFLNRLGYFDSRGLRVTLGALDPGGHLPWWFSHLTFCRSCRRKLKPIFCSRCLITVPLRHVVLYSSAHGTYPLCPHCAHDLEASKRRHEPRAKRTRSSRKGGWKHGHQ